ncbi:hypothetical protein THASP1DRAFT_35174 [Thamnocephalis sphaerospora]|uniref:Phosphoglycerate dehydrogenase n=1 Tax=Thamnocephalis sphaerospora TaxID=78915 RepID=A0A4P9XKF2_9FUNG|nr:hypothetical protein THASP1DRAFT_35174 [Thamnocephalis sphaerospora]|eukprot:RKP06284.1 hypothetical protein THASP1DRAFT_35174 [Thamnocephalis sphaerospora]
MGIAKRQQQIRVLLLENVNEVAVEHLKAQGFEVEFHTKALPEDVLKEKIRNVHVVGIRSKTLLTADILKEAKQLLAIGCFCIGTNQVDLETAAKQGIAVFNSPFSNSRSVAELVIAEVVTLARQLGDRNKEIHAGTWNKVSANCYEIRGKTLGIVGYGHIGTQLSVLAEAMGMQVMFYDVLQIMPLGTARPTRTLDALLSSADFVSLHVPETPETKNLIGEQQIKLMRKGSYLINASRGTVVDIPALAAALRSGHLAGAAVDVYPTEPFKNGEGFDTPLRGCPNTLLTPHIGGSTEEAQRAIGVEVSAALVRFVETGTSLGAVNYPEVDLRSSATPDQRLVRILHTHHNVPGVLKEINNILAPHNVEKQICDNRGDIAYLMADMRLDNEEDLGHIFEKISLTPANILTRLLD